MHVYVITECNVQVNWRLFYVQGKSDSGPGLFTKSRNPRDLPSTLTALLTLWGWFRELSRLLVRSFRDFSSIFEEMAFSKKSFDAIFSPSAANCRVRVAAWWPQQQAAAREVEVEEESRVAVCFTPLTH